MDYGEQMENHFREGRATPEDWSRLRWLFETSSESPDGFYQEFLEVVEPRVFGERVECPECGSMVLPGLRCWGCDEWTAPEGAEVKQ